jgi:hypothetical protein
MIRVQDKETGRFLGTISEEELRFLVDELEEESPEDTDYYIDAATIDMLEADGCSATLIAFLRRAVGSREGLEIQWSRTTSPKDEGPDKPPKESPDESPEESPEGVPYESPDEPPDEIPDESPDKSPDESPETVKVYGSGFFGSAVPGNGLSGSFELAQAILRSAGIPFVASGDFNIGYRLPSEIRVRAEDAKEARRLLEKLS